MLDHVDVVAERLRRFGHKIQWELVGPKLAHGKCVHCGAPVSIEKAGRMFSTRMAPLEPCRETLEALAEP